MRLTGALTHAIYLHNWNVQTMEKLECILRHRSSRGQTELAAVEADSLTNCTEHKPVG